MTRALFTALTLAAWWFATEAITDPYWPNEAASAEAALQRMIDGTD